MNSIAVFDIDGVVADARHRLGIITGSPTHADWLAFFAAAEADPVIPAGAEFARESSVHHEIVWLTARPEQFRALTSAWLARHHLPPGQLLMKPDDDRQPARDFKVAQVRKLQAEHEVVVVVDDDPRVIARLGAEGITFRHATWVPWEQVLGGEPEKSLPRRDEP